MGGTMLGRARGTASVPPPHRAVPMAPVFQQRVTELAKQFGITVRYDARSVEDCQARRNARTVRVLPPTNPKTFAYALHELAHLINPRCTFRAPHFRDRGGCVACETAATVTAIRLAGPLWDRDMHAELGRCLKTYRHAVRTWPAQRAELDTLASELEFFRVQLRQVTGGMSIADCKKRLDRLTR